LDSQRKSAFHQLNSARTWTGYTIRAKTGASWWSFP